MVAQELDTQGSGRWIFGYIDTVLAAGLYTNTTTTFAFVNNAELSQIGVTASTVVPFITTAIGNGTSSSITVNSSTASGTLGTAGIVGGIRMCGAAGGSAWIGEVSEVIITKATTAADTEIMAYLTAKYSPIPFTIPGCVMWLNAGQGITQSGGLVSAWVDQTGNASATSSGTNKPTYVASGIGGQPTLTFGSIAVMIRGTDTLSNNFTMVAVVKINSTTGGYQVIYGNNAGVMFATGNAFNKFGIYLNLEIDSTATISDGNYHVCICTVTTGTNGVTFMVDGVSAGTGTAGGTYASNSGEICSPTQPLDGNISELLEYNTVLTHAQQNTLTAYLSSKYGIPVTLS
jgi:hypothetical protein